MIQGNNKFHGSLGVYTLVMIIIFSILPNIILLNLTVVILDHSYEKIINLVNEKCFGE